MRTRPGTLTAMLGLNTWYGRPPIPPEKLIRALLLQAFYTIRSERQLMEQLDASLLFRWFIGLSIDAPGWHPRVYSNNRNRRGAMPVARVGHRHG